MTNHIVTPYAMPVKHHAASSDLCALACVVLALTLVTGCSAPSNQPGSFSMRSLNPVQWVTPYKVDVIQGNFVSSEQVAQLRPGLTRDQVKGLLGTPLMASVFHADRWDYVFTLQRQGVENQSYKYTVFFKGDQLDRFEGDAMPSESEFISRLDNKRKLGKVPVLEATEAQLNAAARGSDRAAAGGAAAPAGSPAQMPAAAGTPSYPPLESAPR